MPNYVCTMRCYGLHNRVWEVGERVTEDAANMPKDGKGNIAYFREIKKNPPEAENPKPDTLGPPIELDKPLNSMKKDELLALGKDLGMNLDPTLHHFTMRSMINKRLNGDTS